MNKLAITLGALSMLGCGPTLKFTGSGASQPPKPPTCQVSLLTALPAEPYEELGTIHIQYDNTGFIDKPEELVKRIQPEVCKAGGDAALGIANSYGTYIKAKVLSLRPSAATKKAEAPETGGSEDLDPSAPEL